MVNYHNHTILCGHATGTIEQYLHQAEERGITEMGFADHAPIPLPHRTGITMAPDEVETYISLIQAQQLNYRGSVKVKLGFEVDFPLTGTFDSTYFSDSRIDYLIGSCHFLGQWAFDHEAHISEFDKRNIDDIYNHYYDLIEEMVESKLFDIIGHFDLVKKFGHRPVSSFEDRVRTIAKKMAFHGTAAEINTSGLLKPVKEMYPARDIIQIFYEESVPITMGSDSHSPDQVGYYFPETVEMLKKIGFNKVSGFNKRERHEIDL